MAKSTINQIINNARKTNWTLTDDFEFMFINNWRPLTPQNNMSVKDIMDMCVMNIDLPQLGSSVESILIAGEWRIYNAFYQPFTFTITFRDFEGLTLRDHFSAIWMDAQRCYFDEVKSEVEIKIRGKKVFSSKHCLINSVSQVQLNNADTAVTEFTVEFTSPFYTNETIEEFGTDKQRQSEEANVKSKMSNMGLAGSERDILKVVKGIADSVPDR